MLTTYIGGRLLDGQVDLTDFDLVQLRIAEKKIQSNNLSNVNILHYPFDKDKKFAFYDRVIIYQPKGRSLARRFLLEAASILRDDGMLYIAGSNKSGIRSSISDAYQLFGNRKILGYKKGNLIAKFKKRSTDMEIPDWGNSPGISPGTWFQFGLDWDGENYCFHTLPGVFSYQHLDDGTQFLLQSLPELTNKKIIDIGCGYGVIGLITQRKGARFVCCVDNNLLAIACTKKNMRLANQINYRVVASNVLSDIEEDDYDLAISNPPFHTNLETNISIARDIIHQSQDHLRAGGQMLIVANIFLRYDKILREQFKSVERINYNNKFQVLLAIK